MENLPKDLLVKIALELSPSDLIKFCLTDKKYKNYICDNKDFWNKKLEIDYPHALYLPIKQGIKLVNPKNTYIRNFNEIQTKVENFIESQKQKGNLEHGTDTQKLQKDMQEFISEKLDSNPETVYDEIDKFFKYFISFNHVNDLSNFFLNLSTSEKFKREKVKELERLKEFNKK